jgi:hypothetical protein
VLALARLLEMANATFRRNYDTANVTRIVPAPRCG